MIEKESYFELFSSNIDRCIAFAEEKNGIVVPKNVKCYLGFPSLYEEALEKGYINFLGGRKIVPGKLIDLSIREVAKFTFIDGKTPTWVNLYFENYDNEYSYIRVVTSKDLVADSSSQYSMPDGGNQFRLFLSEHAKKDS